MAKGLDFTFRKDKEKLRYDGERPERETHITKRPDRVKQYLIHNMDDLIFDEFSEKFLKASGMEELLSKVPVPLRKEDVAAFKGDEGLKPNIIAENMARVIGMDPKFKYLEQYLAFMNKFFQTDSSNILTRKAKDLADEEAYEMACIYFRAALVTKYNDLAAMYGYARVLRTLYNSSTREDYIGNLKAESLDYLEMLTEKYPTFGAGWYYLGYMYLNLGLYLKAKIAWEHFLKESRRTPAKDKREIKQRLKQIETPLEIERGYNSVLSEKWIEGIGILEKFTNSAYKDWWPLWYYLGVAYINTDRMEEALEAFKRVLKDNPRHIETMSELIAIYESKGDNENVDKYKKKIKLIEKDEIERRKAEEGTISIKKSREDRGVFEEEESSVIQLDSKRSKVKRLDQKDVVVEDQEIDAEE